MIQEFVGEQFVGEQLVGEASVCEALYESVLDSVRDCFVDPAIAAAGPVLSRHVPAPNEIVPLLIGATVEEIERELVVQTLGCCGGNRTHAARMLGLSVRTLRNKIRLYAAQGIQVPSASE